MPKITALPDGSALTLTGVEPFPAVQSGVTYQLPISRISRLNLTANTTFWVDIAAGSDTTGTGAAALPFRTVAKAWSTMLGQYNGGIFNFTIQLVSGTYSENIVLTGPFPGGGLVTILGDATTPSNVTLSTAGTGIAIGSDNTQPLVVQISGIKFVASGGGNAISIVSGSGCAITGKVNFGAMTGGGSHFNLSRRANLVIQSPYTVSGNAANHWFLKQNSTLLAQTAATVVTLVGTPAFAGAFATLNRCSTTSITNAVSFSGSATGLQYSVDFSVLAKAGLTLPGSIAGTISNGGVVQ